MGLVKLSNSAAHHIGCFLKVFKLDDIFDGIADKMNNIGEIEYSWNFLNKKFTMEPCIACTVAYNGAYTGAAHQINYL